MVDQKHMILQEEEIVTTSQYQEMTTNQQQDLEKAKTSSLSVADVTNQSTANLDGDDDIVLFVESKYCTVCHIE
jgi:hypothetical protein